MGGLLLGAFAVEAQYICTAVLILICVLAVSYICLIGVRRWKKAEEAPISTEPDCDGVIEYTADGAAVRFTDCTAEEGTACAEGNERDFERKTVVPSFADDKTVYGRYDKSFTAKLIQSSDAVKTYYADLANELLAFEKTRNRVSWSASSFYAGRNAAAKFAIRGKTLYLYLALNPQEFINAKFSATDESDVKKYESVPLRVKIKSGRGVKSAKELIEILMRKKELRRFDKVGAVRAEDYPYDTTENLLARGLIKLKITDGQSLSGADGIVWADFNRRERVSAVEAQNLMSDEVAATLVDESEGAVLAKPKAIVNIDTLSQRYEPNDTVTIASLKEKKIIAGSVNYVKVLARGVLDKPLTVKMPEFSVDAVKMIVLTGGTVIKLKTKAEKRRR